MPLTPEEELRTALHLARLEAAEEAPCPVCSVTTISKKLSCGHSFHDMCIWRWLRTGNHCPVCREGYRSMETLTTHEDVECSICLEDIPRARILRCRHSVHEACLSGRTDCPECHAPLTDPICFLCSKPVVGRKERQLPCWHKFHRDCFRPWPGALDYCPECSWIRNSDEEDSSEEGDLCHVCERMIKEYEDVEGLDCGHLAHSYCHDSLDTTIKTCNECKDSFAQDLTYPLREFECGLCMDLVINDPYPLPCDHNFHQNCITVWLMDEKYCPVCLHPCEPSPSSNAASSRIASSNPQIPRDAPSNAGPVTRSRANNASSASNESYSRPWEERSPRTELRRDFPSVAQPAYTPNSRRILQTSNESHGHSSNVADANTGLQRADRNLRKRKFPSTPDESNRNSSLFPSSDSSFQGASQRSDPRSPSRNFSTSNGVLWPPLNSNATTECWPTLDTGALPQRAAETITARRDNLDGVRRETNLKCAACNNRIGLRASATTFPCGHSFHAKCMRSTGGRHCVLCPRDAEEDQTSSENSTCAGCGIHFGRNARRVHLQCGHTFHMKCTTSTGELNCILCSRAERNTGGNQRPYESTSCAFCEVRFGRKAKRVPFTCGHTFHTKCTDGQNCRVCSPDSEEDQSSSTSYQGSICWGCGRRFGRTARRVRMLCRHEYHVDCVTGDPESSMCDACMCDNDDYDSYDDWEREETDDEWFNGEYESDYDDDGSIPEEPQDHCDNDGQEWYHWPAGGERLRDNIVVFRGIEGEFFSDVDVYRFCQVVLNVNVEGQICEIEVCQNRYNMRKPPLKVTFTSREAAQRILDKAYLLEGTPYSISKPYTKDVMKRRRHLFRIRSQLRGKLDKKIFVRDDVLFVDKCRFTWDLEIDELVSMNDDPADEAHLLELIRI